MNTTLKALQLKARHQVYTLLAGHTFSSLRGEGYDFSELREYQIGDDIRKINWMISAKLGKPYLKEFHANRELTIVVATFMDGSLYFGTGNSKQKKLTEVATLLGYATHQQNDLFTGLCYTQEEVYTTPPTKQLYHIEQFSKMLYETSLLHTQVRYQASINDLFKRVSKPSLIFVIGDFLEEVDLSLLAQKHEIIAIVIRDTEEEPPKHLGEVVLHSPQEHTSMETYFGKRSIEKYRTRLHKHDADMTEHFTQHDIRYIKICTKEESLPKLLTLFG